MDAIPLLKRRLILTERCFVDIKIWRVPQPAGASEHNIKYSLALIEDGICVFRYDNETGKGDHKHLGTDQLPYDFVSVELLQDAFWNGCRGMDGKENITLTLGVSSIEDTKRQMAAAFRGESGADHIAFASVDLLWKVLTVKRWELLQAMAGGGAMSIREAARRAGRDVKAVHGDIHALLAAGIIDASEGKLIFPYDAVHVDFVLEAAWEPGKSPTPTSMLTNAGFGII